MNFQNTILKVTNGDELDGDEEISLFCSGRETSHSRRIHRKGNNESIRLFAEGRKFWGRFSVID